LLTTPNGDGTRMDCNQFRQAGGADTRWGAVPASDNPPLMPCDGAVGHVFDGCNPSHSLDFA